MSTTTFSSLPQQWQAVSLREVAHIYYGKALRAEDRVSTGSIPVYASGGIVGMHDKSLYLGPSIVIGRKGTVGAVYYISGSFWCIDTTFYLSDFSPLIDIEFLSHILRFIDLSRLSIVVGVPGINRKDIEGQQIPLPPLPEQRRIVTILRQADKLRQLRRLADEKIEQLLPALFYEMFGDCDPHKDYPEGWSVVSLSSVISSTQYGLSTGLESSGEVGVLRMNNITKNGNLDFSDLKYLPTEKVDAGLYDLQPGDILFNRTNSKELVGKTAIWDETEGSYTFASYIIRVRVKPVILPEYLWALLNSAYGKQQVFALGKQAVNMANINTQELGSIPIVLPPKNLQEHFAKLCKSVREQVKLSNETKDPVETLFQSLL